MLTKIKEILNKLACGIMGHIKVGPMLYTDAEGATTTKLFFFCAECKKEWII